MKKVVSLVLAVSLVAGCSTFRSSKETITVTTNYSDASIYVNGNKVGNGTVSTPVKRNQSAQVMVTKPGYQTAYYYISSNLNTTGILDIIGAVTWLLPFIGVLSPGAKSLDEHNIALHLDPLTTPAQK